MNRAVVPLCLSAALLAVALLSGCENGGADANDSFRIEPSSATLSVETGSVILKVVGGIEPLVWTVTDDTMGTVSGGGRTVTYTRTAAVGANTVQVTDSQQWRASATITQPSETVDLTIAANPASLANDDDRSVITVSGGKAPYTWSVSDVTLGNFEPGNQTSSSRIYVRNRAGDNSITVRDKNGNVANIIISQP